MTRTILICAAAFAALPASAGATNPWFPLRPGTTYVYKGTEDDEPVRNVVKITHRTRVVDGVRCRVLFDRFYANGKLVERTWDYYAEDRVGNVFYYGEDTAELDGRGNVLSREGTWHAGVDAARRGLFMPRYPRVGERHHQEFYAGHAEDQFRVTSMTRRLRVPYGSFTGVLRAREWSRLEPRIVSVKYYARGVGQIYEGHIRGAQEQLRLVSVRR